MLACGRLCSLAAFAAFAIILLSGAPALAKTIHRSPYTYGQTFGSALRLLKVDLEFEVTETNAEWGYLLFVYTSTESGERKYRGSFTFVKEGEQVQVALQIPEMPSYHEQMILDRLDRKLGDEHGDPPAPVKKAESKKRKKKKKKDEEDEDEDEG